MTPAELRALLGVHDAVVNDVDVDAVRRAVAGLSPDTQAAMLAKEMEAAEAMVNPLLDALEKALIVPTPHLGFACMMLAARFARVPAVPLPKGAFLLMASIIYDHTVVEPAGGAGQEPGACEVPRGQNISSEHSVDPGGQGASGG